MSANFYDELEINLKTNIPLVVTITMEWQKLDGICRTLTSNLNKSYYRWSCVSGLSKLDEEKTFSKVNGDLDDPIEVIKWFERNDQKDLVLLLEDFHPFLSQENYQVIRLLREVNRLDTDHYNKSIIIQIPYQIDLLELKQEIPYLELSLPDQDSIVKILKYYTRDLKFDFKPQNETEYEDIALACLGLSSNEVENTCKRIIEQKKRLSTQEISLIIKEKEQIIKKSGILEYYSPEGDFNKVGGLDNLKKWLENRGQSFSNEAKSYGLTFPKGVLLLGVPGCGKSLISKTIANEWDLPLLKFDLGKVFGGIVGQSEANIRKALTLSETIAPSILWIDEIEKGLSGLNSSGDSGTSSRVFGTLLTWMQEKKKDVFVIATANNIEQLPPELLRKGRFDEIFFVDLPSAQERKEIFKIHIENRDRDVDNFDLDELVKESINYSGAEIEEAVNEGLFLSYNDDKELKNKHIIQALKETYPLSKTMYSTIEGLRKWAKVRARFASSKEPETIKTLSEEKNIPVLKQERNNPFYN